MANRPRFKQNGAFTTRQRLIVWDVNGPGRRAWASGIPIHILEPRVVQILLDLAERLVSNNTGSEYIRPEGLKPKTRATRGSTMRAAAMIPLCVNIGDRCSAQSPIYLVPTTFQPKLAGPSCELDVIQKLGQGGGRGRIIVYQDQSPGRPPDNNTALGGCWEWPGTSVFAREDLKCCGDRSAIQRSALEHDYFRSRSSTILVICRSNFK